jgi:transcriptional regulator with XRE-family HTH domain
VRRFLGQRLRELRRQHRLSQEGLGELASLSGKFIGEVERGEKSISVDSLYRISLALAVPLGHLADVRRNRTASDDVHKIFALVSYRHQPRNVRRAYETLSAMLRRRSHTA